jgi:hypothetical protein
VNRFAEWLAQTPPSRMLQTHEWMVPAIQSAHIVAIGVVMASVLFLVLRVWDVSWRDQSMAQTYDRFGPWLWWGLALLLLTGIGMVVGEPARQLMALSFWLKMLLVAVGAAVARAFACALRRYGADWDAAMTSRAGVRFLAVLVLLLWCSVVVLGRLIAYDYVWGDWSKALKG